MLPFALDYEFPVRDAHIEVLRIDSGKLCPEYKFPVFCIAFNRGHPRTLVFSRELHTEEPVEQFVHFALHRSHFIERIPPFCNSEGIPPHQAFHRISLLFFDKITISTAGTLSAGSNCNGHWLVKPLV